MCARSAVTPTAFLLKSFALADDNEDCISAILFSPPYPNNPDVVWSNSLCSISVATTIVILSHMSLFDVTVALNHFTRTPTSEKWLMTNLSKHFDFLIFECVSSSWKIA